MKNFVFIETSVCLFKNSLTGFLIIFFSIFSSCHYFDKHIPVGGPCTYKTTVIPARVIYITRIDEDMFDAGLTIRIPGNISDDTTEYSSWFGRMLNAEEIDSMQIKPGNNFQYKIMEIESGTCTPHLEYLIMEKYTGEKDL